LEAHAVGLSREQPDIVGAVREIVRPWPHQAGARLHPPVVAREAKPARAGVGPDDNRAGAGLGKNVGWQNRRALYTRLAS
jgi:hypothetical protein